MSRRSGRLGDASADPRGVSPLCWPLFALLVLAFLPGGPRPLLPGLDPSWWWAINELAAREDLLPGSDWSFTYGPLGPLLVPTTKAGHALLSLAFLAALLAALTGLLWRLARERPTLPVAAALLAVAFGAATSTDRALLPLLVLVLLATTPHHRALADPALGALAPILALTKINLGAAALLVVALCLVLPSSAGARRRYGPRMVAILLPAILVSLLVSIAQFGSLRAPLGWAADQLRLASAHAGAMALPGEPAETALLVALAVLFGLLAVTAIALRSSNIRFWAIALPLLVLAFKHGVVRQDAGHVELFLLPLLGLLSIALLLETRPLLASLVGALLVVVALSTAILLADSHTRHWRSVARGEIALETARLLVRPASKLTELRHRDRRRLAPRQLPETSVVATSTRGTVDVVPWELTWIAANEVDWRPSPFLQLYAAASRELDRRTADHFAGPDAPPSLWIHWGSLDGRHPLWDTPVTWRTLLSHYRAAARPRPDLLVATRRQPAWTTAEETVATLPVSARSWLEVPVVDDGDLLLAEIELVPTVAGRLRSLLLRPRPVRLRVRFADGRERGWRLVPDTAAAGLLLTPLPIGLDGLAAAFEGEGAAAAAILLGGPGIDDQRTPIEVRFRRLRQATATESGSAPPSPPSVSAPPGRSRLASPPAGSGSPSP